MTKSELVMALSDQSEFSQTMAEEVVSTVFNAMSNTLRNGDRVEIRGFGSFKVKKYDGYTGRNPRTGELVDVKPKKLPFFKCGRDLKERVDHWR